MTNSSRIPLNVSIIIAFFFFLTFDVSDKTAYLAIFDLLPTQCKEKCMGVVYGPINSISHLYYNLILISDYILPVLASS